MSPQALFSGCKGVSDIYIFDVFDSFEEYRPFSKDVYFPWWLSGGESACKVGDTGEVGLISGSGRPTGKGNGSPLQDSYWENPLDRGDWWAMGHAVSESLI